MSPVALGAWTGGGSPGLANRYWLTGVPAKVWLVNQLQIHPTSLCSPPGLPEAPPTIEAPSTRSL